MSPTAPEQDQSAQFAPTIKDNLPAQHLPGEFAITPRSTLAASQEEEWFDADGSMSIHNVSVPSVTPFLPDPDKATGAGMVIAPGGGFLMLSVATEGWDVARWLADHGVAAFVVKYRTLPTAATGEGVMQEFVEKVMAPEPFQQASWFLDGTRAAVEDAQEALRVVRADAKRYGIDPTKLGIMGFSAGAFAAMGVAFHSEPDEMPNFVVPIYGPTNTPTDPVPDNAPPMWAAFAADDPLVGNTDFGLLNAWRQEGGTVEFHLHAGGGHGYGYAGIEGTTTTSWTDMFLAWLRVCGLAN